MFVLFCWLCAVVSVVLTTAIIAFTAYIAFSEIDNTSIVYENWENDNSPSHIKLSEGGILMEATFLKAKVEHYSFVTGMFCGGSIYVNVIVGVSIIEFTDHYVMVSDLFQCNDLISFIDGKRFLTHVVTATDEEKVVERVSSIPLSPCKVIIENYPIIPEDFETETWESDYDDDHKWQLKRRTKYSGVKWLSKEHTNPEDSMCSAKITFTCENVQEELVQDGNIRYVNGKSHGVALRRVLQSELPKPKHNASYLGA